MQPQTEQNLWQPQDSQAVQADFSSEQPAQTAVHESQPLSWQASEYIHHEKDGTWFLALFGIAFLLIVIDFFLIQSVTFGILIVVMALSVMIFARRPPRVMSYILSVHGLRINERMFDLSEFRAFGVIQEQAFYSIRLVPNKRFMPMVSVYFPSELGERIVDTFGSVLPMENIALDTVDRIVEKIRF